MPQKPDSTAAPTPPWTAPRKSEARAKVPLTLNRIVDAAIAVIDSDGSAAVTMRRVAGDLGVVASSLYVHVRNREDLLSLALERVLEEIGLPEITGNWQDDLKNHFTKMQRALSAHGDIAVFNFAAFPPTAIGVATTEKLLALLLENGIPARVAAWSLHRLQLYTTADVYEGWRLADKDVEAWINPVRDYFQSLPATEFPAIAGNIDALLDASSDDRFELGLEMLISGIAKFLPNA
ncbi:TetR/AcrR family transcriptional regulator C-terminal domain-containing protein [Actinokineospora sp. G85]|uniref:TetR/AcrR family transcriptional regulator C-terminal domain-containing protein n=1 Tax=Actinokineospora sp. G85 TaxID=3406626 RepID=UPI003C764E86